MQVDYWFFVESKLLFVGLENFYLLLGLVHPYSEMEDFIIINLLLFYVFT